MATSFPVSANTRPAVQQIDQLINALRKTGKEAGMTEKEIEDLVQKTKKLGKEGGSQIGGMNKQFNTLATGTLKRVGVALLAAFAMDKLIEYGKQIVQITAEFQKFEAVLTNTLGSKSRAQIALRQIAEFASKTPFAVKELTEAYVKLANQGFRPTTQEMRKLGDLAASTGKTFDLLTEAIIDAQVGEFERLKEFGIRAKKEGDRVTFTFKGVETQTRFTSDAIREYVLNLGDAVGVSGSMAAISETVGGKISNMGDAFDMLFQTLGDAQSGPMKNAFNNITLIVNALREWAETEEQTARNFQVAEASKAVDNLKSMAFAYGDLNEAAEIYLRMLNGQLDVERDHNNSMSRLDDDNEQRIKDSYVKIHAIEAEITAINEYVADQEKLNNKKEKDIALTKEQIKALEELRNEQRMLLEMLARQNAQMVKPGAGLSMPSAGGLDGDGFLAGVFGKKMEEDRTEFQKQNAEDRDAIFNNEHERRMAIEESFYEASMDLAATYFNGRREMIEEELSLLQEARREEVRLAGTNGEVVDSINRKFAERESKLRAKQARDQQAQAIFSILVNQGPAIAKTVAQLGFPAALPFIGLVLAQFALQTRATNAVKTPKFATGVYDLDGPGTSTSDSIPAMLSRGEDVVPADRNKKFGFLLKEIIENPALELWDVKSLIDQKIPNQYATVFVNGAHGTDASELAREMRATREAMRSLKQVNVNIDESGFQNWTIEGARRRQYTNKRYKF